MSERLPVQPNQFFLPVSLVVLAPDQFGDLAYFSHIDATWSVDAKRPEVTNCTLHCETEVTWTFNRDKIDEAILSEPESETRDGNYITITSRHDIDTGSYLLFSLQCASDQNPDAISNYTFSLPIKCAQTLVDVGYALDAKPCAATYFDDRLNEVIDEILGSAI